MNFHSLEDTYTLNNGVEIPIIGFGTWQTPDGDIAKHAVEVALNAGYRHIDTAAAYGNEKSVGQAIKNSGINRHDLLQLSFGMQIMAISQLKRQLIEVCKI